MRLSLRFTLQLTLGCLADWLPRLEAATSPPNIVVIVADDLGFSDLGCYGGEIETPRLDALAAAGLRYTQFYNTARCWPTRAVLLTGYYAQAIRRDSVPGVKSGGQGARPDWAPLLPAMLQPAGYQSYHSGKWHVDGLPCSTGFAHSYAVLQQGNFFSPRKQTWDDQPVPAGPQDGEYYATTAIAARAVTMLQEHAAEHAEAPFFLYLAFTAPHFPLHALPQDISRYKDRYSAGWDVVRASRWERVQQLGIVNAPLSSVEPDVGPPYHFPDDLETLGPDEVNRPLPWTSLTPSQQRFQATKMALHAAMIDRMDQELGRVLDQLRAMGVWENTWICFLSDNGASAEIMVRDGGHDPRAAPGSAATYLCLGPGWSSVCNTPLRRHKTWVHEGGIATPLVVHWPQGIAARGELRSTPGHVVDLVPTIRELAGLGSVAADVPAGHGRSLAPTFAADVTSRTEPLWWLHEENRGVRVGDWKLVAAKGEPWELYDLSRDRCETRNLAVEEPQRARQLADLWEHRWTEFQRLAKDEAPRP